MGCGVGGTLENAEAGRGAPSIEALVSDAFGVTADHLQGTFRGSASTAFARQVAMYLMHTRLGFSYAAAAARFGRDRTTASYACRIVEERREDTTVDSVVALLETAIDGWSASTGQVLGQ